MTAVALSTGPAAEATDTLAVFVAAGVVGHDGPVLLLADALPEPARQHLDQAARGLRLTGKADETVRVPAVPGLRADLVILTGVGAGHSASEASAESDAGTGFASEALRRAAGAATRASAGRSQLTLLAPDTRPQTLTALAQGAVLGGYRFTTHRGRAAAETLVKDAPVPCVDVLASVPADGQQAAAQTVATAATIALWQTWARDLVNTAPNVLYPENFAEQVAAKAPAAVSVDIRDERALAEGGFGGLIGVGQGSAHPPRLATLSYRPAEAEGRIAFVGKGITFDSGGLCIKPPKSMITMKCDMGGAAAVAAAVCAIAELELPIAVTGYLCLAENMPGANAQRPGDVITMRDGKTVEVINTDAEGRLVLADGIALAAESHPDAIIDVATLTGAAIVALGERTAAVMANDDLLQGELTSAATAVGESVWPMPIAEEIRAGMDSLVADISHMGADYGGAMTAAAFLREFAGTDADGEPTIWGHLDIAGPAYHEKAPFGYTLKGGTGFATRTLVEFARARAQEFSGDE